MSTSVIPRPVRRLSASAIVVLVVGVVGASAAQAASVAPEQATHAQAGAVTSPSERQVVDNLRAAPRVTSHERQVVDNAQRIRALSPQERRQSSGL